LLIANGADVNASNKDWETPLHLAVSTYYGYSAADIEAKRQKIMEILIAKGAEIDVQDKDGNTPLHLTRDRKIAELLIAKGANFDAKNNEGESPLNMVMKNTDSEALIELLIIENNLLFEVVSSLLFGSPRSGIIWIFILVGSFWLMGLWVLGIYLLGISSRIKIAIDRENIRLQRSLLGWHYKNAIGKTQDITQVGQQGIGLSMNKSPIVVCTLQLKSRKHKFGTFLTEPEKAWLVAEINEFLGKH
jgi:Ankyrin repeats (3 copies)